MRYVVLSALLVTFSWSAYGQQGSPDADVAMRAYLGCLVRSAAQIDDQQSDAGTIATAIMSMCTSEFANSTEVFSRGMNPAARQLFYDKAKVSEVGTATTVVLKGRRDRAAAKP